MNAKLLAPGPGFSALVEYLTEGERALAVAKSPEVVTLLSAGAEMEAVASMNTRLGGDTARALQHFTLAWPPDETPSPEDILDAGRRAINELGYGPGHQNVIVIHDDSTSGHRHAHVLINRVHSETYKMHSPKLPMLTLDRLCRQLELDYGSAHSPGIFAVVGGTIVRRSRQQRGTERSTGAAIDGSLHQGYPSLQEWVKGSPSEELRTTLADDDASQADLHRTLGRFNLELREWKRGMVVVDKDHPTRAVPLSHIGVGLTAQLFIERFGLLEANRPDLVPETSYERSVKAENPDALRDEFEQRRAQWSQTNEGQAYALRLAEIRTDLTRRRRALRTERDKARRTAKMAKAEDMREPLIDLLYQLKLRELENEGMQLKALAKVDADATGRPERSYFHFRRGRSAPAGGGNRRPPNALYGENPNHLTPPMVEGYRDVPGPTGRDYFRDRVRAFVVERERVQVVSRDQRDLEAARDLARRHFGIELTAEGDQPFLRGAERAGITTRTRPQLTR
jgi:uncharacterized protein with PIN domain